MCFERKIVTQQRKRTGRACVRVDGNMVRKDAWQAVTADHCRAACQGHGSQRTGLDPQRPLCGQLGPKHINKRLTTEWQGRVPALTMPFQDTVLRPLSLLPLLEPGCQLGGRWWPPWDDLGRISGQGLWSYAFPWRSQRTHLEGEEAAGIRLRALGTVSIWARGQEGKSVSAAGLLPTHLFPSSPQQKARHSTTQANQRKVEWWQGWSSSDLCRSPPS